MTNIEEQMSEAHEILEGVHEYQPHQQKLFRNLSAAADYCHGFGIRHYQIKDGYMPDGTYIVQVSYQRSE